ncbi:response regulator [Rubellimicrobium roseum]|uniref:histidine kinase n=1 Tax=Rubellimicrobium roseum TaxID=687525 RepID=A0A5C4NAL7_9RHOB|nr:response regulator [Rubellimicrobium roseum]TNC60896.1 response regulator [Rubellimicrobium roseum]
MSEPGPTFLTGGGTCGALIASRDWSRTPLGPLHAWPSALRMYVSMVLRSPAPMALLWGQDGILLYNDGYIGIAGARHPAALGSGVLEAWPELAEFHASVLATVRDGDVLSYKDIELQLERHGQPEAAFFNLDYSPVADDAGRPVGVLAVVAETSEAVRGRRAVKERADAERRHDAQTLDLLGQLTGGFAHDFNNLLMPIVAGLDIVRRKVPDERSQRLIAAGLQGAERAATLVQRLLAFSGRQMLRPRPVSPAGLVEGLRDFIDQSAGPGIEVRLEVPPDLPAVVVDPGQLEVAILNLAANAREAMPAGGRITIAAELVDTDEDPLPGLKPGRYVSIALSDTGTGMDEATLRRAVDPFFTTKSPGLGTGLGLSMVHGLALQSGGLFRLLSEKGRGTAAVMFLPLAQESADAGHAGEEARRPLVLLVDDEEIVRLSMAEGLREMGYDVEEVGTAAEALEAVRTGFVPDAVVTDHVMPGMLGADLARALRELRPKLPVLMITGYAQLTPEQTQGLQVLAKPFRQADLASRLAALLTEQADNVVPLRRWGGASAQ